MYVLRVPVANAVGCIAQRTHAGDTRSSGQEHDLFNKRPSPRSLVLGGVPNAVYYFFTPKSVPYQKKFLRTQARAVPTPFYYY